MNIKKKFVIKIGFLGLALFIILIILSPILQKKWIYQEDSAATEIAKGFYAEPDDTLDVIYLGSSYIKNGISPLEIWNSYGITGYVRGTAQQAPVVSYYLAKESFKTQSPKVVVYEASMLIQAETSEANDYDLREEKIHEAIDYMKFSKEKLQLAHEITSNSELSYFDLLLPLYRYHDRWSELTEIDFEQDLSIKNYAYKGHYPSLAALSYTEPSDYMVKGSKQEEANLDQTTVDYVLRLKQLCQDNGAQLVLIHMPNVAWDENKCNIVTEFANSNDIPYLDYSSNELRKYIGYDSTTDTNDYGQHLNMDGAEKVSRHLGNYLKNEFGLEDKRQDESYNQWNEDYELLLEEKKAKQLAQTSNLFDYLEKIDECDYLAFFAAKSDVGTHFNQSIREKMLNLGLKEDLSSPLFSSYIGITDGNNAIYEEKATEELTYYDIIGDIEVSISSVARRGQNSSVSIQVDGEEMTSDEYGLNIVVYSPKLGRVISKRAYNTGVTGREYIDAYSLDKLDFDTYLEKINDSRYIVSLTATKEAAACLSPQSAAKIQAMGFDVNLKEQYAMPYIGVSNGGINVLEQVGNASEDKLNETVEVEGVLIELLSDGNNAGPISQITVNGEKNEFSAYGVNFVVYDKLKQEIVSVRTFATHGNSYTDSSGLIEKNDISDFVSTAREEGYTVMISAQGDIADMDIDSLHEMIEENSLQIDSQGSDSYFGIMDNGELTFQTTEDSFEQEYYAEYKEIFIRKGIDGQTDGVFIDNMNYLLDEEGIQVIVYDKAEDTVITKKDWGEE